MKHIVALSGGKDSTAMALGLKRMYPYRQYEFICTPTGDELPEMVAHMGRLERLLGQDVLRLHNPDFPTLNSLIDHFQAVPNFRMRWCTRILKIEPAIEYYAQNPDCVCYVGLRADEPGRLGADFAGSQQRYPLREWGWGIKEVQGFLKALGVEVPERTDCARCYHQRLIEWWRLWKYYPDRFDDAMMQELRVGHTFRSRQRDSWPASLVMLKAKFEAGHKPRETKKRQGICRFCTM